jgi:hypothetical protein
MKLRRANPELVKIGQQYRARYSEGLNIFYCYRRHKFGVKALLCNTFMLLRMKLSQQYTTHYYFSIATMFMRLRRNVTPYV